MTLALRSVWPDGERSPDDYEIRHDGRTVGRIYHMNSTERELWQWTQRLIFQPTHGSNGCGRDRRHVR